MKMGILVNNNVMLMKSVQGKASALVVNFRRILHIIIWAPATFIETFG